MSKPITAVRTIQDGYVVHSPTDMRYRAPTQDGLVGDRWCTKSYTESHWKAEDERHPEVFCGMCGNDKFTLSFGEYRLDATCSECGFCAEVYSG